MHRTQLLVLMFALACLPAPSAGAAEPAPAAGGAADVARIDGERIDRVLSGYVASGKLPGVSALVYQDGREAYFAAFKAGLAPVNTNYRYGGDELTYLFDNADAEAVVFHSSFAEMADSYGGAPVFYSVGEGLLADLATLGLAVRKVGEAAVLIAGGTGYTAGGFPLTGEAVAAAAANDGFKFSTGNATWTASGAGIAASRHLSSIPAG